MGYPTTSQSGTGRATPDIICPWLGRKLSLVTGRVLSPQVWCRQLWCRENAGAEHFAGDGCTCDGHGRPAGEPEPILLTAKAARLGAFACRACGANARHMIEQPAMFFRCEPCAAANRWPALAGGI